MEQDEWIDCYYCAGTGLAGDGFHDCPVCGGDEDGYDPNTDKYDDEFYEDWYSRQSPSIRDYWIM